MPTFLFSRRSTIDIRRCPRQHFFEVAVHLSGACVLIHSIRQSSPCFPPVIGIAIVATIVPLFLLQILEEFALIGTFWAFRVI